MRWIVGRSCTSEFDGIEEARTSAGIWSWNTSRLLNASRGVLLILGAGEGPGEFGSWYFGMNSASIRASLLAFRLLKPIVIIITAKARASRPINIKVAATAPLLFQNL